MESNLSASIDSYVKSNDAFALFIDGSWGAGKTYYIKNSVIKRYESEMDTTYISLYGYNSLEIFKNELMQKMFVSDLVDGANKQDAAVKFTKKIGEITKDWDSKILGTIYGIGNVFVKSSLKENKSFSRLIIIDDLERLSSEIELQDMLGFILNNLIEELKCRVIVIGNTAEMLSDQSGIFSKIKEKVIGRTIPFSINLAKVKKEILVNFSDEFIKNNSEWICDFIQETIIDNNESLNLRTLVFILNTFSMVNKEIACELETHAKKHKKLLNNEIKQMQRSFFLNIWVISSEYKSGGLEREKLDQIKKIVGTRGLSPIEENAKSGDLVNDIKNKYHTSEKIKKYIFYSVEVNRAVFDGVFSVENLIDEWQQLFMETKEKMLNKLDFLSELENDQELADVQKRLLKQAESDELTAKQILKLLNNFLYLDEYDLCFIKDDFKDILLQELKKKIQFEVKYDRTSIDFSQIKFFYSKISEYDSGKLLGEIKGYIIEANEDKRIEEVRNLILAIFERNTEKIKELGFRVNDNNFFEILGSEEILTYYICSTPSKANELSLFIKNDILKFLKFDVDTKNVCIKQKKEISKLIDKIDVFLKDGQAGLDKLSCFNVQCLSVTLKELLRELTETKECKKVSLSLDNG